MISLNSLLKWLTHIQLLVSLLVTTAAAPSVASDLANAIEWMSKGTHLQETQQILETANRDSAISAILNALETNPDFTRGGTKQAAYGSLRQLNAGDHDVVFRLAMNSLGNSLLFNESVGILRTAPPAGRARAVDTLITILLENEDDASKCDEILNAIRLLGDGHNGGVDLVRPFASYSSYPDPEGNLWLRAHASEALISMTGMENYLNMMKEGSPREQAGFLFALYMIVGKTQGTFNVDDSTRQEIVDFIFDSYSSPDTMVVNQAIEYGSSAIVVAHIMGNGSTVPMENVDSVLVTLDNVASSSKDSTVRDHAASQANRMRRLIEHEETGQ